MGSVPIIEEMCDLGNSGPTKDEQVYKALVMKGKRKLMAEGRPAHNFKKTKASFCPSLGVSLRFLNRGRSGGQAKSKGGKSKIKARNETARPELVASVSGLCDVVVSPSKEMEEVERHLNKMNPVERKKLQGCGGWPSTATRWLKLMVGTLDEYWIDTSIRSESEHICGRFSWIYGTPYSAEKIEFWEAIDDWERKDQIPWVVCGDMNEVSHGLRLGSEHCPLIIDNNPTVCKAKKLFRFEAKWAEDPA
ncbi:unnamed protein product [Prunus armeniaca]